MTDETKAPTIMVCFNWNLVTPDPRSYKPSAPQLQPINVTVGVEVPLTNEFVMNANAIMTAQIASGNGKVPEPILTPIGMRYCIDILEKSMGNPEQFDEPKKATTKASPADDGWEDEDGEDDWDSGPSATASTDDTSSEDESVDWDNETWEEA